MENLNIVEYDLVDAIEKMQDTREKIHLDYATHQEIEALYELENILQDSIEDFQTDFWE